MEGRSWTWKASFVAVRLLAIYLVVHALILTGSEASLLFGSGPRSLRWSAGVAIIVLFAAAIEMWLAGDWVADRIAGVADELDDPEEDGSEEGSLPPGEARPAINGGTALVIGLTILGLAILIDSISGLVVEIGTLIDTRSTTISDGLFVSHVSLRPYYFALGALAIRAALGAWLAFGSKPLAALIHRIRWGTTEPEEPTP